MKNISRHPWSTQTQIVDVSVPTTKCGRREHKQHVFSAYESGVLCLHTIMGKLFLRPRDKSRHMKIQPTDDEVREFAVTRRADLCRRPNITEELRVMCTRTGTLRWLYCFFHVIRLCREFDGFLHRFARSTWYEWAEGKKKYATQLLCDGAMCYVPSVVPESPNTRAFMSLHGTAGHVCSEALLGSPYARPLLLAAVRVCVALPLELIHAVLWWTWGVRLTTQQLQSLLPAPRAKARPGRNALRCRASAPASAP